MVGRLKQRAEVSVGKQCGENETMGGKRVAGLVPCTVFLHVAVVDC
jgi:hypothetical protein